MRMRPRIVIYVIASLFLLAFHAPVRALVSLLSGVVNFKRPQLATYRFARSWERFPR